jgi:hypothetical protein
VGKAALYSKWFFLFVFLIGILFGYYQTTQPGDAVVTHVEGFGIAGWMVGGFNLTSGAFLAVCCTIAFVLVSWLWVIRIEEHETISPATGTASPQSGSEPVKVSRARIIHASKKNKHQFGDNEKNS